MELCPVPGGGVWPGSPGVGAALRSAGLRGILGYAATPRDRERRRAIRPERSAASSKLRQEFNGSSEIVKASPKIDIFKYLLSDSPGSTSGREDLPKNQLKKRLN